MTPQQLAQEVRQRAESFGWTLRDLHALVAALLEYERAVVEQPVTGERLAAISSPSLDLAGVAARLNVSRSTVKRLIPAGLPVSKIGGTWRCRADDLDRWIEANRVTRRSARRAGQRG